MALTEKDFYTLSDSAIKLLDGRTARRGRAAEQKMLIADFDELNVIKTITSLYNNLARDNEEIYGELAGMVWLRAGGNAETKPNTEWVRKNILEAYDPVTLYVYLYEVDRKRDRTIEAVNSSLGQSAKRKAFENGLRYWHDMTREYADQVTFEGIKGAYEEQGVKEVMWITAQDERVCPECAPRNGVRYPINAVPPRPHWNCRCIITPV